MKSHNNKSLKLFKNEPKLHHHEHRSETRNITRSIVDLAILGAAVGIVKGAYK
jgi:hypothetical protein